jgi:hypothetical protein
VRISETLSFSRKLKDMNKSWLLLAGVAVGLSSCVANVDVFSAVNLRVGKPACKVSATGKRELNLLFTYAGTLPLRGVKMTFTPNGNPPSTVTISDVKAPPAGFTIDTFTANTANILVDLNQIVPDAAMTSVAPLAITPPKEQVSLPMDIQVEAVTTGSASIKLEGLSKVDVSECYPPKPVP